jgi:rod shape-determining protein MreC
MLNFLRRNRVLVISALALLVAAGLLMSGGRGRTRNDRLGRLFLELVAPLQRATTAVGQAFTASWQEMALLFRARDENVALRARVRQLQQDLDRLGEVQLENERLRRLLDFRGTLRGKILTARVIGRDATGRPRTLVIDRGERDGVSKGAAVLAPEGVVGHVFLVSRRAARVLLINDQSSGVDALVQRTRARGIVQGTEDGRCILKYAKRTEDVQVGDAVVTSGLEGIFPKGLPVGMVTAVDRAGQGLFQSPEVEPSVAFDELEEVLVPLAAVEPEEEGEAADGAEPAEAPEPAAPPPGG